MASNGNVRVVLRTRPLNEKEKNMGSDLCVKFTPSNKSTVTVISEEEGKFQNHDFTFDSVCDISTNQEEVYNIVGKPVVESVLDGFNGTVLAYGQTSSGKTYTMQGNIDDTQSQGIIPRMVKYIFERIESSPESVEFTVKVSMVEIYMEKIKDLFNPSKSNLKVQDDKVKGIYIEGAKEHYVNSLEEVFDLMKEGNNNRAIGVTDMNAVSSRSHSIFIMTIRMNDTENYSCKVGKMFLVDLAGSEKIGKTNASGQTLDEAKNINKSLTMLGRVIHCLTEGATHIPYRDSKLTRILQDSLGGNSKTCLVITASPSPYNAEETLSTCRFGNCAKSIKNNAKVNREFTVAELKLQIQKLEATIEHKDSIIKNYEEQLNANGITPQKEIINKTRNGILSEDNKFRTLPIETQSIDEKSTQIDDADSTSEINDEHPPEEGSKKHTPAEKINKIVAATTGLSNKYKEIENVKSSEIKTSSPIASNNNEKPDQLQILKTKKLKGTVRVLKNEMAIKESAIKSLICQNEDLSMTIEEQKNAISDLTKAHDNMSINFNCLKQTQLQLETEFKSSINLSNEKTHSHNRSIDLNTMQKIEQRPILQSTIEQIKHLEKIIEGQSKLLSSDNVQSRAHCKTVGFKEGDFEYRQKISLLQRQLEQVTNLYHQMISKTSDLAVKLQKAEKKLNKKIDGKKNIEEENKTCKDQFLLLRASYEAMVKRLRIYENIDNQNMPTCINHKSACVKPIKGGMQFTQAKKETS